MDMFDLNETGRLHLKDKHGNLAYTEDGNEVAIVVFSPGSKQYAKAQAVRSNRMMDRVKRNGKSNQSAEEIAAERAEFLASVTESFENLAEGDLQGHALYKAVYANRRKVIIADQVEAFLNDTSNF